VQNNWRLSLIINKTQIQIEKKKGKYGVEYSLASASDGPCPHGWARSENGVPSPQIFHFYHCLACRRDGHVCVRRIVCVCSCWSVATSPFSVEDARDCRRFALAVERSPTSTANEFFKRRSVSGTVLQHVTNRLTGISELLVTSVLLYHHYQVILLQYSSITFDRRVNLVMY